MMNIKPLSVSFSGVIPIAEISTPVETEAALAYAEALANRLNALPPSETGWIEPYPFARVLTAEKRDTGEVRIGIATRETADPAEVDPGVDYYPTTEAEQTGLRRGAVSEYERLYKKAKNDYGFPLENAWNGYIPWEVSLGIVKAAMADIQSEKPANPPSISIYV